MPAASPLDSLNAIPSFTIKIDGTELSAVFEVLRLETWKEVNRVARARIELLAGDIHLSTIAESEHASFTPGGEIELSLGYNQSNTCVFKGIIVRHALSIRPGYEAFASRSVLILDCSDKAIKMTTNQTTELFENKSDSDILSAVISKFGLAKTIDATTDQHERMVQYNCSSWEFMLKRARANGMVVLNSDNEITITAPAVSASPVAEISYGVSALSFEGEVDATTQQAQVTFKNWNPFDQTVQSQNSVEPSGMDKPGDLTGATLAEVAAPSVLEINDPAPIKTSELKAQADATLLESRFKRIRGSVAFKGMPVVTLGSVITLSGFGAHFNGDAYVAAVNHRMFNGDFITEVQFGLPKDWFSRSADTDAHKWIHAIRGLHIGTVKQLDGDPENGYRILVVIPNLDGAQTGIWARLVQFYATSDAGSLFVPEKDAEVVVGFLGDDPRFPVVLGGLYHASNAPYQPFDKDNFKKAIVSKEKLTIEFDDKDKILTLKTPAGHSLVFDDKAGTITWKDKSGNTVTSGSTGIALSSASDVSIEAKGKVEIKGATGVTLEASGGDVTLKGLNVTGEAQVKFSGKGNAQAELTASGQVTVKGAIVMIN